MSTLSGPRQVFELGSEGYPACFECLQTPPQQLYVVGHSEALQEGLAVVGARKATPYGRSCAKRFARMAAERDVVVISGGARGCDAAAHRAALEVGGRTVAFLGGGCNQLYPAEHQGLFQSIIDAGGAVVSEYEWDRPPLPYQFRARNRLIAGLARATLIVEAGLPSGTFSTADEALAANREVLVVPGAITSSSSHGANRLIYQGATPVVDDDSFADVLFALFGCMKQVACRDSSQAKRPTKKKVQTASQTASQVAVPQTASQKAATSGLGAHDVVVAAVQAQPMGMDELYSLACQHCGKAQPQQWLMERLALAEQGGLIARHPDGRFGPVA